jgi:hypothetical protein
MILYAFTRFRLGSFSSSGRPWPIARAIGNSYVDDYNITVQ